MEISIQTINTKKGTIDYILGELSKCIHLQPGQEKKINLSLDTTRPEYFMAKKDEARKIFVLNWFKNNAFITTVNISTNVPEMAKDVEGMVDAMERLAKNEAEKANFEDRCYNLYQLEWMMSHGYSLDDLYKVMLKYEKEMFDPEDFIEDGEERSFDFDESDLERSAMQARDILLFEQGFGNGQIFVCKEEFLGAEYQDAAYMKWLFETQIDDEADRLKALYAKYTGKQLSCVPELKVHTEAGVLNAYKCADPEHPGICVMLKPNGHDFEIDVTMAEGDGKNINIVNWGDATTEDSTHRETLLWDDIEATLKRGPLTAEELKPIILDEWKKFTFYDGESVNADDIDIEKVPQDLLDEIAFRCDSLETDDITQNIRACLEYAREKGVRALIKEMDDCNIWRYIG